VDELEELLSLRDVRTPVRLRFGRRSDEHAAEELSQLDEMLSRDLRSPVRLRFGRSDEQAVPHIFPKEVNILKIITENY
ncbi:Short neuropeptide F, partial [Operophtera brumata]